MVNIKTNNSNNDLSQVSSANEKTTEYAWYVGATDEGSTFDYSDTYIDEGRWENKSKTKYITQVKSMKPGDKIVIKSSGRTRTNLPFNNRGKYVGFIDIKAIGTITDNSGDGKNITVDWRKIEPSKRWYTFMGAIRNAVCFVRPDNDKNRALFEFTFDNADQDYSWCEDYYLSDEETDQDASDNENIFDGFQSWLTSYNNPKYRGEAFDDYDKQLKKLIDYMYKKGIISSNEMNDLDVNRYREYLNAYKSSKEANDYDYNKLSHKTGHTALQYYIDYVKTLNPSFYYSECVTGGENLVVYGTPGCGKSYHVDHELLGKDESDNYVGDYKADGVIRTTFYQDYSYTDFVGQIVPVIEYEEDDQSVVTYRFIPGPFTLALEYAIAHPAEKTALVVEELNRGNAPSIFGDLFQLLDRIDEEGKEYPVGTSEYGIVNVNIINYLKDRKHYSKKYDYVFNDSEIRIPANLSIFATMNTSDQNVYTLDTAFKRRWEFKKLANKFEKHPYEHYLVPGLHKENMEISWRDFVESINSYIVKENDMLFSEDKQIGIFFVSKNLLIDPLKLSEYNDNDIKNLEKKFAYKVLEYLWNDVAKFSRDKWFVDSIDSLDGLVSEFISEKTVFKNGIITKIHITKR